MTTPMTADALQRKFAEDPQMRPFALILGDLTAGSISPAQARRRVDAVLDEAGDGVQDALMIRDVSVLDSLLEGFDESLHPRDFHGRFTAAHFEHLASAIMGTGSDKGKLAGKFADALGGTNPNFDRGRFIKAATEGSSRAGRASRAHFTRQHFQTIADTLKSSGNERLAPHFAERLGPTNPRFDRARFLKAAGYGDALERQRVDLQSRLDKAVSRGDNFTANRLRIALAGLGSESLRHVRSGKVQASAAPVVLGALLEGVEELPERYSAEDVRDVAHDLGVDLASVDASGLVSQEGLQEANWIQGAIKRKGQLHRDLGVPEDKPIPHGVLKAAASKPGKIGMRARLALKLKGLSPRKPKPATG